MARVEQELKRLRGQTKLGSASSESRRLLAAPGTATVALMLSAKNLVGDFHGWEPETLWVTLEREGVHVPVQNRDKLQAGLALLLVPAFYWDGIVFGKTAIALDEFESNPTALEEASSAQLAWAVKEAAWIITQHGESVRDFQHEPAAYAALVLHREGLVLAPAQLGFAQEILDRMNTQTDLRDRVQTRWNALDKSKLAAVAFEETAEDVQLAHLAAIELHIQAREADAARDLAGLR